MLKLYIADATLYMCVLILCSMRLMAFITKYRYSYSFSYSYSPKLARIWGEVNCSGTRTSVSLPCTDPNSKSSTGLPTPPLVALTKRDWLMGAGPESQKCFYWPLTIARLDPEPWMGPWLLHHYRLSRLPYLIAMHCDQPQIKSWDRQERVAGSPLTLTFCSLMELRWP